MKIGRKREAKKKLLGVGGQEVIYLIGIRVIKDQAIWADTG